MEIQAEVWDLLKGHHWDLKPGSKPLASPADLVALGSLPHNAEFTCISRYTCPYMCPWICTSRCMHVCTLMSVHVSLHVRKVGGEHWVDLAEISVLLSDRGSTQPSAPGSNGDEVTGLHVGEKGGHKWEHTV